MSEKSLNQQQLEAITHGEGPLLIVAGAGTGKTTVITERIKWLITEKGVLPGEILALTFTEKAAREMEERIDIALPYGYTQIWAMTFHSFCDRILKDDGLHIGVNPNYRMITDTTAVALLRRHMFDLKLEYFRPMGNPNKFISGLLSHMSRLKDEDVSVEEYVDWANSQELAESASDAQKLEVEKYKELARICRHYQELKTKHSFMDFGDLICTTLELFRKRPNILSQYQQKFKYILVDEYQDTNYAQNQLVNLLARARKNLTVVADDDQAIYRWRGAAVSNVKQFRTEYPNSKLVVLTHNYRSNQEILDSSYGLIQHNNPDRLEVQENIVKKLISNRRTKGGPVEFIHAERSEDEADAVIKKINELRTSNSELNFKDFAILVRANSHADSFVRTLSRHGMPFQFLGPGQLFHQPEVKDLIAYLRVLKDINDDASFIRVLSMSYFAISGRDLAALGTFAKKYNLHLFEVCEILSGNTNRDLPDKPLVSMASVDIICKITELITRHLSLVSTETAGQILFTFLQESGLLQSILEYKLPIDEIKAGNMTKFFNKLKTFEVENQDAGVPHVVDWIELSMELGESPLATDTDWTQNDAVNIITIHSAKGLEFKIVFLVNLVSQRFPSVEKREPIPIPDALIKEVLPVGDHHLQEERRLCYVGMTRAQDKLFLTAANFYGEGKREKKLSPFIAEAVGDLTHNKLQPQSDQLSLLNWQRTSVETSAPLQLVPVNYLSYSQIQTFLDCPLHYKARYLLKLPSIPTASLSFGNTVHLTMKDFYTDPGKDIFELFKRNWIKEGYTSREQEQAFFAKGEKFLDHYLKTEYIPERRPVLLEGKFMAPVIVNKRLIKIGGKIDRIDVLPDGSIEIIDYKTGANMMDEKEAGKSLQLSFYALAATRIKEPPFMRKPEDIKLSLYYFEDQTKITTTRTAEQLQEAMEEIFKIADEISHSDFKCSRSILCRHCEFKMLCDMV
jgi:DNA helicase II / ATP-dependent DNA helicase PcrA